MFVFTIKFREYLNVDKNMTRQRRMCCQFLRTRSKRLLSYVKYVCGITNLPTDRTSNIFVVSVIVIFFLFGLWIGLGFNRARRYMY